MSQVHLHLLITHLPVFGSVLGALVLAYGIWSKSNQTKVAAYFLFVISALGAGFAYLTGEGAEDAVENIQGVSETIIKQHEVSAMYALISLVVLGVVALFALVETKFKTTLVKSTASIALIVSLISFGLIARTGYLGGQIRHTETSTTLVQGNSEGEKQVKDDD
jgi:glucan phosphoethanolaminetransferase (alkaline phosphatase superfamily)